MLLWIVLAICGVFFLMTVALFCMWRRKRIKKKFKRMKKLSSTFFRRKDERRFHAQISQEHDPTQQESNKEENSERPSSIPIEGGSILHAQISQEHDQTKQESNKEKTSEKPFNIEIEGSSDLVKDITPEMILPTITDGKDGSIESHKSARSYLSVHEFFSETQLEMGFPIQPVNQDNHTSVLINNNFHENEENKEFHSASVVDTTRDSVESGILHNNDNNTSQDEEEQSHFYQNVQDTNDNLEQQKNDAVSMSEEAVHRHNNSDSDSEEYYQNVETLKKPKCKVANTIDSNIDIDDGMSATNSPSDELKLGEANSISENEPKQIFHELENNNLAVRRKESPLEGHNYYEADK